MFCGSAAGQILPPYVVYKGANVYEEWCTGGPKGTVYTATQSGWFDSFSFLDWFKKSFLPSVRRLQGKKILIGDNLSTHISVDVINLCRENDIEFVCFPPNAPDKMQPLDVGFFGPMKQAWRNQLTEFKIKNPSENPLDKFVFPSLLKELCEHLKPGKNHPSAFKKCGLSPLNRDKVLERIPSVKRTQEIASCFDSVLSENLEVSRFGKEKKKKQVRGKKVPAGQSYSQEEDSDDSRVDPDNVSSIASNSDKEEEAEMSCEESSDSEELPEPINRRRPGSHVVAVYEGEWFIAEVCIDQRKVAPGYTRLMYMSIKGNNCFAWGPPDLHITLDEDIILNDIVSEPVTSRGHIGLKKSDPKHVVTLMVVVYLN